MPRSLLFRIYYNKKLNFNVDISNRSLVIRHSLLVVTNYRTPDPKTKIKELGDLPRKEQLRKL